MADDAHDLAPDDPRRPLDPRDFSRRTQLANERTYLAWWRTGIATLTVSLAVARIVPDLSDSRHRWPYTVLGVAFAVVGLAAVTLAEQRRRAVDRAIRAGGYAPLGDRLSLALTV